MINPSIFISATVFVCMAAGMMIAVGGAFWVSSMILGTSNESVTSMAMQQGGLGLILTTLIVSAPPMAAMLFQGTLGQFSPYSAFNQQSQPGAPGQPGYPATGGYQYTPQQSIPTQTVGSTQAYGTGRTGG